MAIELRTFASGDTDYISKMNANVSDIEAAINALQSQAGAAGPGTALAAGMFLETVFNEADCLIGPGSYFITQGGSTVSVQPGGMYLGVPKAIVKSYNVVPLNFGGQTAGLKYIVVGADGTPVISTSSVGAIWSVYWNGSAFIGAPVRICPVFYDAAESTGSRQSTAIGGLDSPPMIVRYNTLDERLEAIEELAVQAAADAATALTEATAAGAGRIRKVGCTVGAETGIVGAIQLDFAGEIVGWSVIANAVGDLTVEVSRLNSLPPPSVPNIPDVATDKISASAPVQLSAAQSAARAEAGVSTWDTVCEQWDVIQFMVTAVTGLTRATLYLRILETPASPE